MVWRALWSVLLVAGLLPGQVQIRSPAPVPGPLTVATAAPDTTADEECSVGVAAGFATADGRPLLWKNRDAKAHDNVVTAFADGRFPYVAICDAGSTKSVWGGANAAGFCIMNSVARDLAGGSEVGPANGAFMKLALRECATVADFVELLEESGRTGRRTRANFGVIDAAGGAAIFETSHRTFVRFDAADGDGGIIVRTNFAATADGDRGRERFARAGALCFLRPEGHEFDHGFVLRAFCRDLLPPPSARPRDDGRLDARETIHRQTTVAAMVFHGVREREDPRFTTMWAVLGQPLFSIAVPCWPAAGDIDDAVAGTPRSAICDAARALQAAFYDDASPADDERAGDADPVEDEDAGDLRWLRVADLPKVRAALQPVEERILTATRDRIDAWRAGGSPPDAATMLTFHREQARAARRAVEAAAERFAGARAGR